MLAQMKKLHKLGKRQKHLEYLAKLLTLKNLEEIFF